jgi:acid phosphatase (class A)
MKPLPKPILLTLVLGLVLTLGLAGYAQKPADPPAKLTVDAAKLLPGPPADNSAETKAEVALMLSLQEKRTPAEIARAQSQAKLHPAAFADVMGPWFTPEKAPATMALMDEVNLGAKSCCDAGKKHFARRRPRFIEPQIKPIFEKMDEPCYPSGHSTQSMAMALVLAELCPERKAALVDRALEIGWNRIIAGVHYPSDNVAGRVLGQAIAQAMLADPAFQAELAKAKAEMQSIKGSASAPPAS